jgi:hypothetical protein
MYLFSRRTRLAGGNGRAGLEWAVAMCERVNQITGLDVGLWGTVYSEGFGTISFTTFLPDLAALEAAGDKLQVDDGYLEASDKGAALTIGGLDDSLLEIVHGVPDPSRNPQYVSGVTAVCASGHLAKGMTVGVEIAQRAEKITGLPTLFVRGATGPYGGVGWLTGYEDIGSLESAQQALADDASWLEFLDDEVEDAYAEDPSITQSTIYRKLA